VVYEKPSTPLHFRPSRCGDAIVSLMIATPIKSD
jgi:hypothetical protein